MRLNLVGFMVCRSCLLSEGITHISPQTAFGKETASACREGSTAHGRSHAGRLTCCPRLRGATQTEASPAPAPGFTTGTPGLWGAQSMGRKPHHFSTSVYHKELQVLQCSFWIAFVRISVSEIHYTLIFVNKAEAHVFIRFGMLKEGQKPNPVDRNGIFIYTGYPRT